MSRTERVEHTEATEHGTVSESVESRIEKRAKGRAAIRAASDGAIQNVEERGESEEESADRDVPRPIDDTAGDGARGADCGNGIGMDAAPDQPVRDRIDDAQIPVFQPVRQNLHSVPSRKMASGPAGDTSSRVAVEPLRSEERRVGKECRSRWSPDH